MNSPPFPYHLLCRPLPCPIGNRAFKLQEIEEMNRLGNKHRTPATVTTTYREEETVVCPRPRRPGILIEQLEISEANARKELLDMILTKGNYGGQNCSSPPGIYCGSPPSRAPNPVIQDVKFGNGKEIPLSISPLSSSPSSRFGHKPATVRIEGFDCHCQRSCSSSISTFA